MLGKLIKYEFNATSRFFAISYPALLVTAILSKIFAAGGRVEALRDNFIYSIVTMLLAFLYVGIIFAVLAGTTIFMIQRFYKNMLGDEGYLMHTLPVEPWQHVTSKILVSAVWMFVSFVVTALSICILVYGEIPEFALEEILRGIREGFSATGMNPTGFAIWISVTSFISLFTFMLPFYAAISVGQLWRNHRILGSVLAYLGVYTVIQIISSIGLQIIALSWGRNGFPAIEYSAQIQDDALIFGSSAINNMFAAIPMERLFDSIMLYSLISSLIISVGLFFLTSFMLKRKLDLE